MSFVLNSNIRNHLFNFCFFVTNASYVDTCKMYIHECSLQSLTGDNSRAWVLLHRSLTLSINGKCKFVQVFEFHSDRKILEFWRGSN